MIALDQYYDELLRIRRWLHRHPELSMQEYDTSEFIYHYLQDLHISCRRPGETGVIGTLYAADASSDTPTIAVRAEIDALPISEETGLPFVSEIPGRMHACGHDGIAAVVLCLAKVLSEHRDMLTCNVRFLFEPGEETGEGAQYMIEHGALTDPDVDSLLLFHYGNQEPRGMEIQKSISTAAIGGIQIHVHGKSTHWFQPECGHDALYAASRLIVEINRLNQLLAPLPDPPADPSAHFCHMAEDSTHPCHAAHPFILGFGLMNAGTAGNIMADTASLTGSLRAFTTEDYALVWNALTDCVRSVAQETQTEISLECPKQIPPIINHPELVKKGAAIGKRLMGARFMLGETPFLVGDNAAYYLELVPGMRTVFLAGKPDTPVYPVHNPKFDFDESVMLDALSFLYQMLTT